MPEEAYWESLFNVPLILDRLGIGPGIRDAVEVGCGYGTFTLPVAKRILGILTAIDIDPAMVDRAMGRAKVEGLRNVEFSIGDVMTAGLADASSQDAILLFNILHGEQPQTLLEEATRVLRPGGWVFVIHWNFDPSTPRGPSMDIRPKSGHIVEWALGMGLLELAGDVIDLPPWHYGIRFRRKDAAKG